MPSEETPTTVTSQEGTQIPVRMENGYPAYTDSEGKQLTTGHDISPGTEKGWGLGDEVEHNPEKAHHMAAAGVADRTIAKSYDRDASDAEEDDDDESHAMFSSSAQRYEQQAKNAEEEAGRQYDAAAEKSREVSPEIAEAERSDTNTELEELRKKVAFTRRRIEQTLSMGHRWQANLEVFETELSELENAIDALEKEQPAEPEAGGTAPESPTPIT